MGNHQELNLQVLSSQRLILRLDQLMSIIQFAICAPKISRVPCNMTMFGGFTLLDGFSGP